MYRYDAALASTVKFPPYYEGKIFFMDWERQNFRWININPNGTIPAGAAGVHVFTPTGITTGSYIDAQFGPEGALYLLRFSQTNYTLGTGSALYRVEYTGSYDNSCYQPFVATVGTAVAIQSPKAIQKAISPVMANGLLTLPVGYRTVELYDISGRQVWSYRRTQTNALEQVKLPANLANGIWQAKLLP